MKTKVKTLPKTIPHKHVVVYDSIFKQQVDVFLNFTGDMYVNWLNRKGIQDVADKTYMDNFAAYTTEYTDANGKVKAIVFVKDFQWTLYNQGTLIHEITHVIIKIWARNNISFNEHTQEFLAHSIGNMYEDIGRKLLVKK